MKLLNDDGFPKLWIIILASWFLFSLMFGAMNASNQRSAGNAGCIYKSIASTFSPGYVVGCELFRRRWELGK